MADRTQNLADIKSRITSFVRIRGPVLPIQISKECKTTLLLASAFLSDLVSEKTLKISNLKVGGSPVYFLPGQEAMLENFQQFMPGKEREAFFLLKESKILKDDELEPAIRVALRNIKDFAKPYAIKFQDKSLVFWQHFLVNEEEARKIISQKLELLPPIPEEKMEVTAGVKEVVKEETEIKPEKTEQLKPETPEIKPEKKKREKKPLFTEQIKAFLSSKNIEILNIEKSSKKEMFIKAREYGKEYLLLALDRKKINEADILKAHRRAQLLNLPYTVLAKGEASKKLKESIEAHKNLDKIRIID